MTVLDERMPERITQGFRIGPEAKTTLVRGQNGHEWRNRDWLYPKYRAEAQIGAFTDEDRQALLGLFHAAGGRHKLFRLKDPTDWLVVNEPCAPVLGTTDALQLSRAYEFGGGVGRRLLQAPVNGTVVVRCDGEPVPVTVDHTKGLVTPDAPWATGIYTFDCQFDIWMRFDSDWCSFTAVSRNVWTAEFGLVEVRR